MCPTVKDLCISNTLALHWTVDESFTMFIQSRSKINTPFHGSYWSSHFFSLGVGVYRTGENSSMWKNHSREIIEWKTTIRKKEFVDVSGRVGNGRFLGLSKRSKDIGFWNHLWSRDGRASQNRSSSVSLKKKIDWIRLKVKTEMKFVAELMKQYYLYICPIWNRFLCWFGCQSQ